MRSMIHAIREDRGDATATERWLPVVGWEDRYEVSDLGRVRSHTTYHGVRPPRIMATETDRYGYVVVRLNRPDRVRVKAKVHLLVLAAFCGPLPIGKVTRHLNGDPSDNRRANLTYGTQGQNMRDVVEHGRHRMSQRTHCGNGHEYTPENTRRKASKAGRICITCDRTRGRIRAAERRSRAAA